MYYKTIKKLEDMSVDREYIQGWAGGFLGNPKREEQRVNEAYEAGYEDGGAKIIDKAANFIVLSENSFSQEDG